MVDAHCAVLGKTRSGKTFRAYRLFENHVGPAVFCDIQWASLGDADYEVQSAGQVVDVLRSHRLGEPWPHIRWLMDTYEELGPLVDYLKRVHRDGHIRGYALPRLAIFMDEVWKVAPTWADARNPAVRVFTEGMQHNLLGVAISQWPAQTSRLIAGNTYDVYIFALWPKDERIIETIYRMVPPSWEWVRDASQHHYWRYDGEWWKGDENGLEVRVAQKTLGDEGTEVPEMRDSDEEVLRSTPGTEVHMEGDTIRLVRDRRDGVPNGNGTVPD